MKGEGLEGGGPEGGGPEGGGPEGGGAEGWGAEGWGAGGWGVGGCRVEGWGPGGWEGPEGGPRRVGPRRAQNFALFFPSPALIFVLFLSLGVFSWNFGGVFEGRDPLMCTFGVLGLSCEIPACKKLNGENEGNLSDWRSPQ